MTVLINETLWIMHFYLLSWRLRFCLACDSWRLKGQDSRDPFEVGFFRLKMMLRGSWQRSGNNGSGRNQWIHDKFLAPKVGVGPALFVWVFQLCFSECSLSRKKWSGTHRDENLRRKGDEGRRFTCCLCHEWNFHVNPSALVLTG